MNSFSVLTNTYPLVHHNSESSLTSLSHFEEKAKGLDNLPALSSAYLQNNKFHCDSLRVAARLRVHRNQNRWPIFVHNHFRAKLEQMKKHQVGPLQNHL